MIAVPMQCQIAKWAMRPTLFAGVYQKIQDSRTAWFDLYNPLSYSQTA